MVCSPGDDRGAHTAGGNRPQSRDIRIGNGNADGDGYRNCDTYSDATALGNTFGHSVTHRHPYTYGHADTHEYANANRNLHPITDKHALAHRDPDPYGHAITHADPYGCAHQSTTTAADGNLGAPYADKPAAHTNTTPGYANAAP